MQLESQGNRIYRRTIARLFSGEMDALDVIRWKDISASMRPPSTASRTWSDIVTTIVVKQA